MLLDEELWDTSLVIRLKRRDIEEQIASRYIAKTTNLWHTFTGEEVQQYERNIQSLKDEHFELCDAIAFVVGAEIGWDKKEQDIQSLDTESKYIHEIFYEDLIKDPKREVNEIERLAKLTPSDLNNVTEDARLPVQNKRTEKKEAAIKLLREYKKYLSGTKKVSNNDDSKLILKCSYNKFTVFFDKNVKRTKLFRGKGLQAGDH